MVGCDADQMFSYFLLLFFPFDAFFALSFSRAQSSFFFLFLPQLDQQGGVGEKNPTSILRIYFLHDASGDGVTISGLLVGRFGAGVCVDHVHECETEREEEGTVERGIYCKPCRQNGRVLSVLLIAFIWRVSRETSIDGARFQRGVGVRHGLRIKWPKRRKEYYINRKRKEKKRKRANKPRLLSCSPVAPQV